ncbi:Tetraacyldisaccharide 4'-kinase [Trichinella spiralis]|uniref:Tetraacyldisaccharide 4'-kinase n=1 Tax=Trichinella spiralis TaxID=6334 RepID=A0ABR3KU19_TRISP
MIWSRPDLIDSLTWVCACLKVRITDIGSGPSMDGRQSTWRHLAPLVMATIVAPVDLLVRTNWRRFLTFAVAVVLVSNVVEIDMDERKTAEAGIVG